VRFGDAATVGQGDAMTVSWVLLSQGWEKGVKGQRNWEQVRRVEGHRERRGLGRGWVGGEGHTAVLRQVPHEEPLWLLRHRAGARGSGRAL